MSEVIETNGIHIRFHNSESTLCGNDLEDTGMQTIPDYRDPGVECSECMDEYEEWKEENGSRAPTVECQCDRTVGNKITRCRKTVPAKTARQLYHPKIGRNAPVCEQCYRWLRSLSSGDISSSYEDAEPWI